MTMTDRARPPTQAGEGIRTARRDERGDAEAAFANAPVQIDMRCSHAREHHNAMEPHATIAEWEGDRLTLYDKSQWVDNVRIEIAHVFGMREADIHVISPLCGRRVRFGAAHLAACDDRRSGGPACRPAGARWN